MVMGYVSNRPLGIMDPTGLEGEDNPPGSVKSEGQDPGAPPTGIPDNPGIPPVTVDNKVFTPGGPPSAATPVLAGGNPNTGGGGVGGGSSTTPQSQQRKNPPQPCDQPSSSAPSSSSSGNHLSTGVQFNVSTVVGSGDSFGSSKQSVPGSTTTSYSYSGSGLGFDPGVSLQSDLTPKSWTPLWGVRWGNTLIRRR
jgi:hypothetical protein